MTLTSAAVDVAVMAWPQRFLPVSALKVPKIQATKGLLYSPDHGIKPGAVGFALIWNKRTSATARASAVFTRAKAFWVR